MTTDAYSLGDVGVRLRSERERIGLSQADFGPLGGVTRQSQAAYESGKRAPDADYLIQIAARGIDVGFLFSGLRSTDSLDDEEAEMIACLAALDRADRAALLRIAGSMAGRTKTPTLHAPKNDFHAEERR